MRACVAVYDPATGNILRVVGCPADAAEKQARAGEAVVECEAGVSDATHRVVEGVVEPLP